MWSWEHVTGATVRCHDYGRGCAAAAADNGFHLQACRFLAVVIAAAGDVWQHCDRVVGGDHERA